MPLRPGAEKAWTARGSETRSRDPRWNSAGQSRSMHGSACSMVERLRGTPKGAFGSWLSVTSPIGRSGRSGQTTLAALNPGFDVAAARRAALRTASLRLAAAVRTRRDPAGSSRLGPENVLDCLKSEQNDVFAVPKPRKRLCGPRVCDSPRREWSDVAIKFRRHGPRNGPAAPPSRAPP
jgi:hypothetical protein